VDIEVFRFTGVAAIRYINIFAAQIIITALSLVAHLEGLIKGVGNKTQGETWGRRGDGFSVSLAGG
jgi:hypothetical protein